MPFSVMFWNVENFGRNLEGTPNDAAFQLRVDQVEDHIRQVDNGNPPDVIGCSEIKDRVALRNLLMERLHEYEFAITDGAEGIELLAGWRRDRFQQVLFTQRREFKADNPFLRPGSLASFKFGDVFHNILFLHTDSGRQHTDYQNRQDMFEKIWSLKRTLDRITEGGDARFIAIGDLNTMGRSQSGDRQGITGQEEIDTLERDAEANGMRLLGKNQLLTWRGTSMQSNLDHALATTNMEVELEFVLAGTANDPCEVSVNGWIDLLDDEQVDFADNVSDHCSLFLRVGTMPGPVEPPPGSSDDVVIAAALVNPSGPEAGNETVTLRNTGLHAIGLGGWTLEDPSGTRREPLFGSVPAGGSVTFGMTTARLRNAGGTITLFNNQGAEVDRVEYSAAQARPEDTSIEFT